MAEVAEEPATLPELRGVDARMGAPLEICSKRSVVAVLASGVVISLTALTGGIAPAFAKPDTDQVVTTTAPAPEPKIQVPDEAKAPTHERPAPKAPADLPAAPSVVAPPPQTQQVVEPVEPPPPPVTQTTTASPPATMVESPEPRLVAPPVSEAPAVTSTAASPSPAIQAPPSSPATAATSASPTASVGSVPPSAALVAPSSAMADLPSPSSEPKGPTVSAAQGPSIAATTGEPTVSVTQAAKVIQMSEPQILQAPKADVELARNANPVEVKTNPAAKHDVAELTSSIGVDLGVKDPLGVDATASAKVDTRLAIDRERVWDRNVRQWSPDWVQYDEYYRPIILTRTAIRCGSSTSTTTPRGSAGHPAAGAGRPRGGAVRGVQLHRRGRHRSQLVNAAVDTAVNVAVGSFFGGGYVPAIGLPLPPPPPPVLRYDNVPVQVRYYRTRCTSRSGCSASSTSVTTRGSASARCCSTAPPRLGRVDPNAKRRTAIRGAPDPAVPGSGRSAGGSAARRLPAEAGRRRVVNGSERKGHLPVRRGRGDRGIGLRRHRAGPIPRTSQAAALRRVRNKKRGTRCGCPSWYAFVSAALVHAGVDLRDAHLGLNVIDPTVVADVGLCRARQAEHRCDHSAGDDGGESRTSSFFCPSFFVPAVARSRIQTMWCR